MKKVSKKELIEAIAEVEKDGPLSGLTRLYVKISETRWARDNEISPSLIATRIKEYGIKTTTVKAKRRITLTPEHLKKMQEGRINKEKTPKQDMDVVKLTSCTPSTFHGTVKKIKKGSLTAAVKLKCLECSGYHIEEVRNCPIENCALWNFRPYRDK